MSVKSHLSKMTEGILNDIPSAPVAPTESERRVLPSIGKKSSGLTAPGALAHFSRDFQEMESEMTRIKSTQGMPATLLLTQIKKSPYQTRKIDEAKIAELVDNFRFNPLSTPISVRKLEDGQYELIAGHHRLEAYSRLGRNDIPCSVISLTNEEAEKVVFYDNLMAPQLTDYEKYAGFSLIKKSQSATDEQLAAQSGLSRTLITYLMSFERLPQTAIALIDRHPSCIGANLAAKLAALPASLHEKITEGIQLLIDGRLSQTNLIDWIESKAKPAKPEVTTIKAGRLKFADIVQRANQVTIRFSDPEEAQAIQEELVALLKSRASSQR